MTRYGLARLTDAQRRIVRDGVNLVYLTIVLVLINLFYHPLWMLAFMLITAVLVVVQLKRFGNSVTNEQAAWFRQRGKGAE